MKRIGTGIVLLLCLAKSYAQTVDTLSEVIVTANKFQENSRHVAQKVEVLTQQQIASSLSNNTGGLLEQSGKVFVQRSQLGGGSPVLRGFEASRILLVVDGVRMNNAIYRTGHLQNVITIDDDILEKVEIIYGPASTIYGSDALGGVLHFRTRAPQFSHFSSNVSTRFSSAYREFTGHADVNIGGKKLASLTSVSYSSFGDLRMGRKRGRDDGNLGLRPFYIDNIGGMDSIVSQKDDHIQQFSNYKQWDLLQKFSWQPKAGELHQLNLQHSNTNDVPRYDRLTDLRNGKLRWAEWYYGPQERWLASYQYTSGNLPGYFDQLMVGASYQKIQESRMQRAYRQPMREHRIEDIQVIAFNADLRKSKGRHELNVGVDGQFNFLNSTAFLQNVTNRQKESGIITRYPDGDNTMHYAGAYAQHLYKIIPGKLILNDGLRISYVTLNSRFVDTALLHLPFTSAQQRNVTYSANVGLIYLPDEKSKLSIGVSSGFRAPNIDDIAKVFESAGGTQLVVPNPDLKPEQTINFDLGLSRNFAGKFMTEVNLFYSLFRDAITMDRFTLNGQSSVMYDEVMTPVVANQNKAKASIYGAQGAVAYQLMQQLRVYSQLSYTYGRYTGTDGRQVPMDHIPPIFGKTGATWQLPAWGFEAFALYNSRKKVQDYNPFGEDNLQYATPEGMPGWYTLNASVSWKPVKQLQLQAAVENILDRHYRVFASGISSAGRNFVLKVKANI